MEKFIINKDDTFMMLVDLQEKLAVTMKKKVQEELKKNCNIMLKTAKQFDIPVIVTEQYRKGLGETIPELQDEIKGLDNLEKTFFDCTKDAEIDKKIQSLGRKTAILMGIEAHICLLQTAMSLLKRGYKVIIAADAVASRKKLNWQTALKSMETAGAVLYPTETISFMIIEQAGTAQFKALAPLFK